MKNVNFYVFSVANDLVSTCRKFKLATLKEYVFLNGLIPPLDAILDLNFVPFGHMFRFKPNTKERAK